MRFLVFLAFLLAPALAGAATVTAGSFSLRGHALTPPTFPDDTTLGIAGSLIEDFEDTALLPGLSIDFDGVDGSDAPVTALPQICDATCFAFFPLVDGVHTGQFDGNSVIVNAPGNNAVSAFPIAGTRDMTLAFDSPQRKVGFSLSMAQTPLTFVVNQGLASEASFDAALLPNDLPVSFSFDDSGAEFNGYLVFEALDGAGIESIEFVSGRTGDGWLIDHLAFGSAVIPAPAALPLLTIAMLCLVFSRPDRRV